MAPLASSGSPGFSAPHPAGTTWWGQSGTATQGRALSQLLVNHASRNNSRHVDDEAGQIWRRPLHYRQRFIYSGHTSRNRPGCGAELGDDAGTDHHGPHSRDNRVSSEICCSQTGPNGSPAFIDCAAPKALDEEADTDCSGMSGPWLPGVDQAASLRFQTPLAINRRGDGVASGSSAILSTAFRRAGRFNDEPFAASKEQGRRVRPTLDAEPEDEGSPAMVSFTAGKEGGAGPDRRPTADGENRRCPNSEA
jgi:hypothetical protein